MTKTERKLLREMLHRLECYYPVMNGYERAPWGDFEQAKAHNTERASILKAGRKLVTKLCRVRKREQVDRLGNHFI